MSSAEEHDKGLLEVAAKMQALREAFPGLIYVIQCGDFPIVKIGHTKSDNLQKRFHTLQGGNPFRLKVLTYFEGEIEQEKALHQRFWGLRVRGEWFRLEGSLVEFVRSKTAQ